jgi:hypothetical protein
MTEARRELLAKAYGLCRGCVGRLVFHACGTCKECGARTSTVSHALCRACGVRLGECVRCRVRTV